MQSWNSIFFAIISFILGHWLFENNYAEITFVHASPQAQKFISVEGADFKTRYENALRLGRGTNQKFWTAYAFDVRPGVAVDAELFSQGNITIINGVTTNASFETRNLGIFLLHDANTTVRLEIYNLDRQREYSGYPVYWLGRAGNEESLQQLRNFMETPQAERVSEHAVRALALHDDARVGALLKSFVQTSKNNQVRKSAVLWLGQFENDTAWLANLVRDESESLELRKQAAFSLGQSKGSAAPTTLQNLYATVTPRELKRQIIFAASRQENTDAGLEFLIKLAENEPDRELKKQALFWLGQKAGERSLKVLRDFVEKPDGDTEVQKQAVFALSQKPKDEAVPALIKIARSHKNLAVRKQAMFWLGQSGDERATAFFKEILAQ